jgi:hypothetical protein
MLLVELSDVSQLVQVILATCNLFYAPKSPSSADLREAGSCGGHGRRVGTAGLQSVVFQVVVPTYLKQ